jgi:uncharacterized protein YneF (UPF0154 family)
LELGFAEMKISLIVLGFSVKLCVLLIWGSFVTSVSAQSALTVEGPSSLANNSKMSAITTQEGGRASQAPVNS